MGRKQPLPKDYDHLRVERNKLYTPDGVVPLKQIGCGLFSDVYQVPGMTETVVAVTCKHVLDKSIVEEARAKLPQNPHIPEITTLGRTARSNVYVMPYYHTLNKRKKPTLKKKAASDAKILSRCSKTAMAAPGTPQEHNDYVMRCAEKSSVSASVREALKVLHKTASKYSKNFLFEFPYRNLAADEKGNLVLLDVIFNNAQVKHYEVRGR